MVISSTVTDVVCNGESNGSISLNVVGGVGPYSFLWSQGATTMNIDQLVAGIYNVTVTDANGCNITSSVEVKEPPILTAVVQQTVTIDCDNRVVSETATAVVQGGFGPYSYSWDGNAFSSDISTNLYQDGTYTVIVRDANNCETTVNFEIALPVLGESEMFLKGLQDPQGEYTFNTPIVFEMVRTEEVVSWEWDLGDGNTSNEETFEYTYADVGQYLIRLTTTDSNGCTLKHELNIVVDLGYEIIMPTAFTPNADGLNDNLYPEFYGIREIRLYIYNTWGELIFVSDNMESGGWNGLVNEEEAPAGGYAYKLYATSISGISIEKAGSFLLVNKE